MQSGITPRRTLAFVAFGSEETLSVAPYVGRLGVFRLERTRRRADQRGRLHDQPGHDRIVWRRGAASMSWAPFQERPARAVLDERSAQYPDMTVDLGEPPEVGASDFYPFCLAEVPYVFFWTDDYTCYHKACDTADRIDYEPMGTHRQHRPRPCRRPRQQRRGSSREPNGNRMQRVTSTVHRPWFVLLSLLVSSCFVTGLDGQPPENDDEPDVPACTDGLIAVPRAARGPRALGRHRQERPPRLQRRSGPRQPREGPTCRDGHGFSRGHRCPKTVTATAAMVLFDEGRLELDGDVNAALGFSTRNPNCPARPITFRHLLTHTSSIVDADYYDDYFEEGDSAIGLGEFVGGYVTPGSRFYDANENFASECPGEHSDYSNIAVGLLGHAIERIARCVVRRILPAANLRAIGDARSFVSPLQTQRRQHRHPV